MAKDDKVHEATPRRKREARQKGQVAKSADLAAWTTLLVGLYVLPAVIGRLADAMAGAIRDVRTAISDPEPDVALHLLGATLRAGFVAAAPLMAVAVGASVLTTLGQVGVLVSPKALKPDFKRVNPKQGFKRLFSVRSLWETVKQVGKFAIIAAVGYVAVEGVATTLVDSGRVPLGEGIRHTGDEVLNLARVVAWTIVVLAIADYGYQRWQHRKDMKMSTKEIKDEHKQQEGDQQVKGRIRSMQLSMARNRMIADMGDADVVITNPTHIAVALRYDPVSGGAPKVLAIGAGSLAARIRERALDLGVPMVEMKPLARALWRACDVGDEIPVALYEAVAKVLAFVRRVRGDLAPRGPVELPSRFHVDEAVLDEVPRKRGRR